MRTLLLVVLLSASVVRADEAAILGDLRAFLETRDEAERRVLAARIAADPAYERAKVAEWLHRAAPFAALAPGRQALDVTLPDGSQRRVVLRVPRAYDPGAKWPLVYALHGMGGNADQIVRYVEHVLGDRVEEYLVAAPDQYRESQISHAHWPPLEEHPRIRAALRRRCHLDNDRVYVTGYSMGGHASWAQALLHADEFAAALPLAGTLLVPADEELWQAFLPNAAALPITCVWGAEDRGDPHGGRSEAGGIAGLNRRLAEFVEGLPGAQPRMIELPDHDHYNVLPPAEAVAAWLAARRVPFPPKIDHAFRHVSQARAAWLAGADWVGPAWDDEPPRVTVRETLDDPATPERVRAAVGRAYRNLCGELRGEISGQTIRVSRKRVRDVLILVGDGMIDWAQPVELVVAGRTVFSGELEPDLLLCLTVAERRRDFDRLAWSGWRYRSGRRTEVLDPTTDIADFGNSLESP